MSGISDKIPTDKLVFDNEVVVERILFDTMYKKKITFKDWMWTKTGIGSLAYICFLGVNGELEVYHILGWLLLGFFMVQKTDIVAFDKDRKLWGKILLKKVIDRIEERKKVIENLETPYIIEQCKKIRRRRRIIKKKKKRTKK